MNSFGISILRGLRTLSSCLIGALFYVGVGYLLECNCNILKCLQDCVMPAHVHDLGCDQLLVV